jgi:hypothetical protein
MYEIIFVQSNGSQGRWEQWDTHRRVLMGQSEAILAILARSSQFYGSTHQ